MSLASTGWPTVTATPLSSKVPAPGKAEITTACSALAGVSLASLKPKSAVVSATLVSSLVVSVLSAPEGASLTDVTLTSTLAEAVPPWPSLIV